MRGVRCERLMEKMDATGSLDSGAWLTRGTVWLALSLYVLAEGVNAAKRDDSAAARWLSTAGFVAFVAHVMCAFSFFHRWSHAAAYVDTASQTERMTGWRWGGDFISIKFLEWYGWR